ncbi:hypothetical protein CLAVI_000292 [Candidatus Clavichlamydia salmonicola]|nr:hypothetical protein [Candidatus Clavichlamydia salmonicola]
MQGTKQKKPNKKVLQYISKTLQSLKSIYRGVQERESPSVPYLLFLSYNHILHRSEVPIVDTVKIWEDLLIKHVQKTYVSTIQRL